jgi:hypothetical protein
MWASLATRVETLCEARPIVWGGSSSAVAGGVIIASIRP